MYYLLEKIKIFVHTNECLLANFGLGAQKRKWQGGDT